MLQMPSNATTPTGALVPSTGPFRPVQSPECEIHTWGHRLGGIQSRNGIAYLLHEQ